MFYHVLLTTKCDLKCKYCYEKSLREMETDFGDSEIDYSVPSKISYDIEDLREFIEKDPEASIIFYGGEPLLCIDEMEKIMDTIRVRHFIIQTNGLHLDKLKPEYLNRLSTIFVSIDGDQALTDYYRGEGVYGRIIEKLRVIREKGFKGEVIARMTVMEETDIYKQVLWLLNNPDYPFSSVHWQIDAGFWRSDIPERLSKFERWMDESYNPGIRKLVHFWVERMEKSGKVLRIYPFLAVMESLLKREKSLLRCGSGWANYSIQTDGHIIPCPIMNGMKDFYLGHIRDAHPLKLKKVYVGEPCISCEIYHECGGRCLYANLTKRWPDEAYKLVCETVKNMIESLRQALPKVRNLISTGKICLKDFEHAKYNSCEVIP
ncbi:radical SAM/SPASM domain-containing protein [Candidatus Bathyarchaeota archaeon]|nr:MAG: radical SAM/SPASM domain-containing protein [Candidatus Bathyarchaeota archaeon]